MYESVYATLQSNHKKIQFFSKKKTSYKYVYFIENNISNVYVS